MHKIVMAAVVLFALPARAQRVDVDLGVQRINWNFDANPLGDGTYQFGDSARPFVMRRLEIKLSDFYGFEAGLNQLSSQLLDLTHFANTEDDFSITKEPVASVFGGYARYRITSFLHIQGATEIRRFELSRELESIGNSREGQFTYLPMTGKRVGLDVGDVTTWSVSSRDFQVGILVDFQWLLSEFEDVDKPSGNYAYVGLHRLSYDAPIGVDLSSEDGSFEFTALMGSQVTATLLDFSAVIDSKPDADENPFDFGLRVSSQIGRTGLSNSYLEGKGGASIGLGGELHVAYAFRLASFAAEATAGAFAYWFKSIVGVDGVETKRDIDYFDILGDPAVLPKGSVGRISVDREETYYGPFVTLAMHYDTSPTSSEDSPTDDDD